MRKNLTLLLLLVLLGSVASAQYYYLPYISTGKNPGNVNTDTEYPVGGGLDASWTSIQNPSATPAWSGVQSIPFAFNFNGVAVSNYKVSTSGILTFDTGSALAAPSATNATLPSASIPDNSVCVWGITGTGTNDIIVTKTFGTAPNRQYWVMFSSYSLPGLTGSFIYFSIVLEESTNNIYLVDQRTSVSGASANTLTLGVQMNSTTAISVPGAPSTTIHAGANATSVDNSYYKFVYGTQASSEAELLSLNINQFVMVPGSDIIEGTFINFGTANINSITVKWENAGNIYSDTQTGLNIAFGGTYYFTHSTPFSVPLTGNFPIKVWIELAGDPNQTNDTLNTVVSGLTFMPTKKVVFEEATGTWCGWCPRGTIYMDSLASVYPTTALLVAVHNSDPMTVAAYDAGMGALISGYPSGLVDRFNENVDPSTFFDYYADRINDVPPCNIDIVPSYNAGNANLTIDMTATLATDLNGDYRFNAVVVEEDVTGTGSTWAQTNYYSGGANGAMGGFELLANPVPAIDMHYNHVGREILGGWDGQSGSLPASMVANGVYNYTFNYTVPSTYDISKIHVIGWITDPSGRILNANRGDLAVGLSHPTVTSFSANIYPNPASSANSNLNLNLKVSSDVTIEMYDMTGKLVRSNTSNLGAGEFNYALNLHGMQSGVYTVKITANGESLTKRLVIAE